MPQKPREAGVNLTHPFQNAEFPARKEDLIRCARHSGEDAVLRELQAIPDREYGSGAELAAALEEVRRSSGQRAQDRGGPRS